MRIFILLALITITGCKVEKCTYETNQELRREIFKECLKLAQKQPHSTVYNDTAEVVSECDDVAFYQSKKQVCVKNYEESVK